MRRLAILGLLFATSAHAQSVGSLNLAGPSTTPGAPQITSVLQLNDPINTALADKADAVNGVLTTPTIAGGTIAGTPISGAPGLFTTLGTTGIGTFGAASQNQIGMLPQATGTSPMIQAQGIDTNLDLILNPKGTGVVRSGTSRTLRGGHLSSRPDLNGGTVWAGNSSEGVSNLFVLGGVSGNSGTGTAAYNYFAISSDTVNCSTASGHFCSAFEIDHNFGGAAMHGARNGLNVAMSLTSTSANTGSGGGYYVGGQFTVRGTVNDNGTNIAPAGLVFGLNPVAGITAAATYYQQVSAMEANVFAAAGSNVAVKVGVQIVATAIDAVQGTIDDVALSLNNQAGAVGWENGLEFGRYGGTFPITTTGSMISGQGALGVGFTVANGIDWSLGTASAFWLKFGTVFTVTGAGVVSATGYKVGATVGVSCPANTVVLLTLVVTNGIVTHC